MDKLAPGAYGKELILKKYKLGGGLLEWWANWRGGLIRGITVSAFYRVIWGEIDPKATKLVNFAKIWT